MTTVIDILRYKPDSNSSLAVQLLPIISLSAGEISIVQKAFEEIHKSETWCGYAILNDIPPFIRSQLVLPDISKPAGIALFSRSSNPTYFAFKAIETLFYLAENNGHIVQVYKSFPDLLNSFRKNQFLL